MRRYLAIGKIGTLMLRLLRWLIDFVVGIVVTQFPAAKGQGFESKSGWCLSTMHSEKAEVPFFPPKEHWMQDAEPMNAGFDLPIKHPCLVFEI